MPEVRVLDQRQRKTGGGRGNRERIYQAILSLARSSQRDRLLVGFPNGHQHGVVSVHKSDEPLRRGNLDLVRALHFRRRVKDVRAHE